jgi:predicted NBD/HSP70 family sugar kinase
VVAEIVAGIDEVLSMAPTVPTQDETNLEPGGPVDPAALVGIGIGVPGIVEDAGTPMVHAATIGWKAVALVEMLREAGVSAPVQVGNGAKTQAQAEMWFGAARGVRHAVVALVGSGVGAAVISDGVPYQGASSSAGEWGHTTLVYGGRACRCGARGCLEAYVGAEGVLDRYRLANHGRAAPGADEETAISGLLASPSKTAAKVLTETVGYLGAGFATLINLFNPERIVLGGWAGLALGDRYLTEIRAATAEHALRQPFAQTSIVLCELGQDAVALGAATLPVAHFLDAHR